jgi:poly(3-hydroxybutyrate) depolymerase
VRPDHPRIADGVEMRDVRFYSGALGRQMNYRVFLPAHIPSGQKLFSVYLLHGAYNDFRSWSNFSDVSQFARDGFLLVMPEGGASSYFLNAVEAPKERFASPRKLASASHTRRVRSLLEIFISSAAPPECAVPSTAAR